MTTHRSILAIGLALKAIEHGHRTYFLTLHDLVNKVRHAREKNRLHGLHATLQRADVWLLDELGFQPLDRDDATFLFEAVNKTAPQERRTTQPPKHQGRRPRTSRYQHGSSPDVSSTRPAQTSTTKLALTAAGELLHLA